MDSDLSPSNSWPLLGWWATGYFSFQLSHSIKRLKSPYKAHSMDGIERGGHFSWFCLLVWLKSLRIGNSQKVASVGWLLVLAVHWLEKRVSIIKAWIGIQSLSPRIGTHRQAMWFCGQGKALVMQSQDLGSLLCSHTYQAVWLCTNHITSLTLSFLTSERKGEE